MTTLSVLNLVPVREGQSNADAISAMIRLAQETEKLGYARYWIAEHHNTANLVSSATQILIGHTLAHTDKIRVGSGGVMLPNHTPLIVAEQYGTPKSSRSRLRTSPRDGYANRSRFTP